jgi:iron complex outermembrane receptor protein
LELFGDGGSVAGSSEVVPESGINRDAGLQYDGRGGGVEVRVAGAIFRNRVDHWITFIPQSQSIFVARNIGSARIRGDEWSWRVAEAREAPRWSLEGDFTRLDARDLGVDIRWYAGKTLPGRPARQLHQRASLRLGFLELGYNYEYLGRNYLDRWTYFVVARRDLHGVDFRATWRELGIQLGLRNLTDSRAADVANFPLPGRTFFMTTTYTR